MSLKNLIIPFIFENFDYINLFFYFLLFVLSWLNLAYILQGINFFSHQNKSYEDLVEFVNSKGFKVYDFERSLYSNLYNHYLNLLYHESTQTILARDLISREVFYRDKLKNRHKKRLFLNLLLDFFVYLIYLFICYIYFIYSYSNSFYYFLMILPLYLLVISSNIIISSSFNNKLKILMQNLENFEIFLRKKMMCNES